MAGGACCTWSIGHVYIKNTVIVLILRDISPQLPVTYRMKSTSFRMTLRRVPAVDEVAMDPLAQGQGLGKEHGICKELQGRAELQRKAMARWLLR